MNSLLHESVAINFIPLLDNDQNTWIVAIPQILALNLIIRYFIVYMHVTVAYIQYIWESVVVVKKLVLRL